MKKYILMVMGLWLMFAVVLDAHAGNKACREFNVKELKELENDLYIKGFVEKTRKKLDEKDWELLEVLLEGPASEDGGVFAKVEWHPQVIDFMLEVIRTSTETKCVQVAIDRLHAPQSAEEVGQDRYNAIVSTLTKLLENKDGGIRYFSSQQLIKMGKTTQNIVFYFYEKSLKRLIEQDIFSSSEKGECIRIIREMYDRKQDQFFPLIKEITQRKLFLDYFKKII